MPPAYYGVLVPLVSLLTLLPISLNGMGLRELATVVLLAPLGVGAAEAVTLAVLSFAVSRRRQPGRRPASCCSAVSRDPRRSEPMTTLSVVIPIKDERDNLRPLHERLRTPSSRCGSAGRAALATTRSSSSTTAAPTARSRSWRSWPRPIRASRWCGCAATSARRRRCRPASTGRSGDVLVTMDGDLQNDPADIPMLLAKLDEGYDAVLGLRANRQDQLR